MKKEICYYENAKIYGIYYKKSDTYYRNLAKCANGSKKAKIIVLKQG